MGCMPAIDLRGFSIVLRVVNSCIVSVAPPFTRLRWSGYADRRRMPSIGARASGAGAECCHRLPQRVFSTVSSSIA